MTKAKGSARSPKASHIHKPGRLALQRGVETLYPDLWLEIFSYTIDIDCDIQERIPWSNITDGTATSKISGRTLSSSNKSIDPSRPLRIISHVCRYWRSIMSDAPLLWSQVIDCGCTMPMWLSRVLIYAKDAPLVVRFSHLDRCRKTSRLDQRKMDKNLFLVLVTKNEFREFHGDFSVVQPSSETIAAFLERFRHRMPHLTTLSLNPGTKALTMELFNSSPLNLFQGTIPPKLTRATFTHGLFSNHPTSPWRNLTYLSISNFSLFEFLPLSLLQQTPVLEHLVMVIHDLPNLRGEAFFPARGRVKLPYLARIHVSGPLMASILLLGSLEPPLALTSLICRITECNSGSMAAEFATILHGVCTPDQKNAQSANTIRLDLSTLFPRIHVATNETGHKYHFSYEPLRIDDSFTFMAHFRPFFHSCSRLIVEAEELGIDLQDHYSTLLFDVLPWFDNVQMVALRETTYPLILPLLADGELPRLREVIMPSAISKELGYMDQLSNFLAGRMEYDRPVCTLNFPSTYGNHKNAKSKKKVKMLKKLFEVNIKFRKEVPWAAANLKDEGLWFV
ncbi:hypothetical protein HYPSUDRAFT_33406 [Hypholoma sublateritium FD-334 SS-4]|uniref:Uncharacterized protein n=1 Tax=Hypholoma sublateritium (strain FD-334 SS-4) TaxID=945553 RepID=A0A0D2MXW8_HYPSF|nr:hypothetical protein HYPSUDRAFT_33406 [Hypholoma sublateritium FD-334 SS-4]